MSKKLVSKMTTYVHVSKTAQNKLGEIPIVLKIIIDSESVSIRTGIFVQPQQWDSQRCRILGKDAESKKKNLSIDDFVQRAENHYDELVKFEADISVQIIRDLMSGKSRMCAPTLFDVWDEEYSKMEMLVGKDFSEATLRKYRSHKRVIQAFLKSKFNKSNILIDKINLSFIEDFRFYLLHTRDYTHNTVCKLLRNLKKIISIAIRKGFVLKNPFEGVSLAYIDVDRPYLTEGELRSLMNHKFTKQKLAIARDMFVFSCFTGLAYTDARDLRKLDLEITHSGTWIKKRRQKTNTRSNIPLLDVPLQIINRYADLSLLNDTDFILPMICNQKINLYLKEIGTAVKVQKEFSFHAARHTFATTVTLMNGVPIETVSKMLGHTSIKTTQHYAKVVDKKVEEDMHHLSERISNRLSLAI